MAMLHHFVPFSTIHIFRLRISKKNIALYHPIVTLIQNFKALVELLIKIVPYIVFSTFCATKVRNSKILVNLNPQHKLDVNFLHYIDQLIAVVYNLVLFIPLRSEFSRITPNFDFRHSDHELKCKYSYLPFKK